MNDVEYECPTCGRFGYDPTARCRHCGYSEEQGVTPEVMEKVASLAQPVRRGKVEEPKVFPQARKPMKITLSVMRIPPTNTSFAPPTPFMQQREQELKEARPAAIQIRQPRNTAADRRVSTRWFIEERPQVTLSKEEFLEAAVKELLSSNAIRRVHAVLLYELERYWVWNECGDVSVCIDLEHEIASYLNSLPPSYRRRPKRTNASLVSKVLIKYSRTGFKDQAT